MSTAKPQAESIGRFILGRPLGQMLHADTNNFAALRLALALAVLVSHAYMLRFGTSQAEPLINITGYTLGQHAVQGFFILSGILVAQSLMHARKAWHFALARALRIMPALAVCVVLTAVVMGPLVTTWPVADYIKSQGVAAYIVKTVGLVTGSAPLPGVFEGNAMPGLVNSSLWTLKYEALCYLALGVAGFTALALGRVRDVALLAGGAMLIGVLARQPHLGATNTFLSTAHYFALFFGTGVLFYALRSWLIVTPLVLPAVGLLAALAIGTRFAEMSYALAIGYGLLVAGAVPLRGIRRFTNDSDYSYGFYIYSVPVTQVLLHVWPLLNVTSLILATLGLTLLLAFLSWEIIERPALELGRILRQSGLSRGSVSAEAAVTPQREDVYAATQTSAPSAARIDTPVAGSSLPPHGGPGSDKLSHARPDATVRHVGPEPLPVVPPQGPSRGDGWATVQSPPQMGTTTRLKPEREIKQWLAWTHAPASAPLLRHAPGLKRIRLHDLRVLGQGRADDQHKPDIRYAASMQAIPTCAQSPSRAGGPAPQSRMANPKQQSTLGRAMTPDAVAKAMRDRLARHGLAKSSADIEAEMAPASALRSQKFLTRMGWVARPSRVPAHGPQASSEPPLR